MFKYFSLPSFISFFFPVVLPIISISVFNMNFYDVAFLTIVASCSVLTWRQYRTGNNAPEDTKLILDAITPRARDGASRFNLLFLSVYCIVMASDWLQGTIPSSTSKLTTNFSRAICIQLIQRPIRTEGRNRGCAFYNRILVRRHFGLFRGPIRR